MRMNTAAKRIVTITRNVVVTILFADVDEFRGSIPRMVKQAGGGIWSPYFRDLDRAQLDEAKALGLRVIVWTVNEIPDMHKLIVLGVDGIITDYPDRLLEIARQRGIAPSEAEKGG